MPRCHRCRYILWNKIFLLARHTEVKWPTMYRRKLLSEITMSWRGRCGPFECVCLSRVTFGDALSCKYAYKEIDQEDELSRSANKRRDRYEHVNGLLWHKEHVLSRIIDAAHLASDSNNVHREEYAVRVNEDEPKM